jgi:hypothetical protein
VKVKELDKRLQQSALVMRIVGWGIIAFGAFGAFIYPPGVLWGSHPMDFPHIGPAHPPSPYDGFHPYVFMILALYLAWAILLIRGAKDPKAAASLFDWGILANLLHALLMLVQAFIVPNEHAHLWADVPALLGVSVVMWIWHPNRVVSGAHDK